LIGSLYRDTMAKAFKWYMSRIEAVDATDRDFIEQVDAHNVLLQICFISIKSDDF
jgi:hypothetical protein